MTSDVSNEAMDIIVQHFLRTNSHLANIRIKYSFNSRDLFERIYVEVRGRKQVVVLHFEIEPSHISNAKLLDRTVDTIGMAVELCEPWRRWRFRIAPKRLRRV